MDYAPKIALLEARLYLLLPARTAPVQLCVFDTSAWESAKPLVVTAPDDIIGFGSADARLLLVCSRAGLVELSINTVVPAVPVPAVFIPSDREASLVRLGQLFAEYCINPQAPPVAVDFVVGRQLLDSLSAEVANAPPKQDPRWAETERKSDTTVEGSLIILDQLEEKLARHRTLLAFLQRTTQRGQDLLTLGGQGTMDDYERIQALVALRREHVQQSQDLSLLEVIATALDKTRDARDVYQKVSSVDDIVQSLGSLVSGEVALECADKPAVVAAAVSRVLEVMVASVDSSRHALLEGAPRVFSSWLYRDPIRRVLLGQIGRIEKAMDSKYTEHLLRQAYTFALIGLSGLEAERPQLELHSRPIIALFERHQLPLAFALAERFQCLGELARLCDLHDPSRRETYGRQFDGFGQAIFQYYMGANKAAAVLQLPEPIGVSEFLDPYADLAWIKHVEKQDYSAASKVLGQLCEREEADLHNKHTLLSLASLTAIAGGTAIPVQVDDALALMEHQTQLARLVAKQGRADPLLTQHPLKAAELASAFAGLGHDNSSFIYALEVCFYIPDLKSMLDTVAGVLAEAVLFNRDIWQSMRDPERAAADTAFLAAIEHATVHAKLSVHVTPDSVGPAVLVHCAKRGLAVSPTTLDTVWQLARRRVARQAAH